MPLGNKKKIKSSIITKANILDTADNVFMSSIRGFEKSFFSIVTKLLNKFSTAGGLLLSDDANTALLLTLSKRLKSALKNSTFSSKVGAFLPNFDKVEELNLTILEEVNGLSRRRLKKLLGGVKADAVEAVSTQLLTPAFQEANLIRPLRKILFKHISRGSTLEEAKKELRLWIKGDNKRRGQISRYVGQIARDALNQYDGTINQKAYDEFDMDGFYYVGSLIKDSRPQCVRWVKELGGVIPADKLEEEIEWMHRNGGGVIPGTDVSNFAEFRGGYNCRHTAIPYIDTETGEDLQKLKINLDT